MNMTDFDNIIGELSDTIDYVSESFKEESLSYINLFTDYLNECYVEPPMDTIANESNLVMSAKKFPVLVILTIGNSPLATVIRKTTGDTFSHSSISFKTSLNPMYSFGENHGIPGKSNISPLPSMGFVKTHPKDILWHSDIRKVPYSIYGTLVDYDTLNKMKNRLEFFLRNAFELKYSFSQLVRVKLNITSHSEAKWFCSRFVAEILNAGKDLPKDPSLYRPQSFTELVDMVFLHKGPDLSMYQKVPVEKALKSISPKADIGEAK